MKCSGCNGDFWSEKTFEEHNCPRTSPPSWLAPKPPGSPRLLRTPPLRRKGLAPIPDDWRELHPKDFAGDVLEKVYERFPEPSSTYKILKNDEWEYYHEEWKKLKDKTEELKRKGEGWIARNLQKQQTRLAHQSEYEQKKRELEQFEAAHTDAFISHRPFSDESIKSSHEAIERQRDADIGSGRNRLTNLSEKFTNCGELSMYAAQVVRDHGYEKPIQQMILEQLNNSRKNHIYLSFERSGEGSYVFDPWLNTDYPKGAEPPNVRSMIYRWRLFKEPVVYTPFATLQYNFPLPTTDEKLEKDYLPGGGRTALLPKEKRKRIVHKFVGDVGFTGSVQLHEHEIEGLYASIKKGAPALDLNLASRYLRYMKVAHPQEPIVSPSRTTSRPFSDKDFEEFASTLRSSEFSAVYERFIKPKSSHEKDYARETLVTMLQNLHRTTYDFIQASAPRFGRDPPPPVSPLPIPRSGHNTPAPLRASCKSKASQEDFLTGEEGGCAQ